MDLFLRDCLYIQVEKAVDEREAQGRMREELMTKQRRSLWLVQAFSRVTTQAICVCLCFG